MAAHSIERLQLSWGVSPRRASRTAAVVSAAAPPRPRMLYMVVETFRGGDARPVYRRFRDQGRLAPAGLRYVASWVTADFRRCFQVMECDDPALLERWLAAWGDLVDFEVTPVVTSAAAAALIAPQL